VVTPELVPVRNHDAVAPAPDIPSLAAPAAVPAPVAHLVRAAREGAVRDGAGVEARGGRVGDGNVTDGFARLAVMVIPLGPRGGGR